MKSGFKPHLSKCIVLFVVLALLPFSAVAKKKKSKDKEDKPVYVFKAETEVKHTPVKSQYRTSTCWCFATISFLEAEVLRMGKEEIDLSEMYPVRLAYHHKAMEFVRMHGRSNFTPGGQAHDVLDQVRRYGLVPDDVYHGLNYGEKRHNHGEMASVLKGIMDAVIKRRGRRVTPRWMEALEAVLDVYLGKVPETFTYKGKSYTPKAFAADYLGINPDNYIELTSYTHHPFYKPCRLEMPDNWTYDPNYYNLPIDEMEAAVDHALKNGYTIVWDGDVSELDWNKGRGKTNPGSGYGIVPEKDWADKTMEEKNKKVTEPVKEKVVTQELRQKTFDNYTSSDDHLMHMVGIAHDQKGTKFYIIKNSWGTDSKYKGYYYMSQAYFRLKTTALLVNKNSLPAETAKKLNLK